MIKYINTFIITVVFFLLSFICYNAFLRYTEKIPVFTYTEIKSNIPFSSHQIPKNKETIIAYVSTACGSCESTVQSISKNFDYHKTYIIITSEKSIKESRSFFHKLPLDQRVILLNDKNNDFIKDFKLGVSVTYPTILTFNKDSRLVMVSNRF